jgi:hypothetical protein
MLRNRINRQFHSRAEGLTLWISDDGKQFEKLWSADKMKGQWLIDLPEGTRGQYLRVGLDGKGTFHLHQIAVFAE